MRASHSRDGIVTMANEVQLIELRIGLPDAACQIMIGAVGLADLEQSQRHRPGGNLRSRAEAILASARGQAQRFTGHGVELRILEPIMR